MKELTIVKARHILPVLVLVLVVIDLLRIDSPVGGFAYIVMGMPFDTWKEYLFWTATMFASVSVFFPEQNLFFRTAGYVGGFIAGLLAIWLLLRFFQGVFVFSASEERLFQEPIESIFYSKLGLLGGLLFVSSAMFLVAVNRFRR